VRYIDRKEAGKIVCNVYRFIEFLESLEEMVSSRAREVQGLVTSYMRLFDRVSTVIGEATVEERPDGFILTGLVRGIPYKKTIVDLFFFELTRYSRMPIWVEYDFFEKSREISRIKFYLYWLQKEGYLSAYGYKKDYPGAKLLYGVSEKYSVKRGFCSAHFAEVEIGLRILTKEIELEWTMLLANRELIPWMEDALRTCGAWQEKVFRMIVGSVLAQMDSVIKSRAFEQARESVLSLLESL